MQGKEDERGEPPPGGVLSRLRRSGILPRKALGQHFLHDPRLLRSIVAAAEIDAGSAVLEIGTGPGTLTRELARAAGRVLTVEVDPRMAAFARRELEGAPVEVIVLDALAPPQTLHPDLVARLRALDRFDWVSNLPYGIATPLIIAFLEAELPWRRAVLTVQAEVAERLAGGPAAPGGRRRGRARRSGYGPATLLVAWWAAATVVRRIPPGAFWPPPKVESAVIRLDRRPPPASDRGRYERFKSWVHLLFGKRRKQIATILREHLGPKRAAEILAARGWRGDLRPENLTLEDYASLAREPTAGEDAP